jgi:hypothetical protein
VCLNVLLEILRTFESLLAEVTLVWLQWNMDADMRRDVITLDGSGSAVAPTASQVEVICRLATNMLLTDVVL